MLLQASDRREIQGTCFRDFSLRLGIRCINSRHKCQDIYSGSVYVQNKSPCKKRFPSPLMKNMKNDRKKILVARDSIPKLGPLLCAIQ